MGRPRPSRMNECVGISGLVRMSAAAAGHGRRSGRARSMHIFEFQHTTKVAGIIKRGFGDRFVQVIAPRVLSASHHNHELGFYGKDEPNKEVAVLIGEIILPRLKTYCRPRVLHDTKWNLLLIKNSRGKLGPCQPKITVWDRPLLRFLRTRRVSPILVN